MLVVYCLRNTDVISAPHGLPEFAAVAFTAAVHVCAEICSFPLWRNGYVRFAFAFCGIKHKKGAYQRSVTADVHLLSF